MAELSRQHTYIRYDQRGSGLSDSDAADFSLEAGVADLEAVVEALGLVRFPLLGMSQGGAVAIAYATRHPEQGLAARAGRRLRLRRAAPRPATPRDRLEAETLVNLIRLGWGRDNAVLSPGLHQPVHPEAARRCSISGGTSSSG